MNNIKTLFIQLSLCSYGCLLLSSCSQTFWTNEEKQPNTPKERMQLVSQGVEKIRQKDGEDNVKKLSSLTKHVEQQFSEMGYAVTKQVVHSAGAKTNDGSLLANVIVYKPGLYANNKSIVIGTDYNCVNGGALPVLLEIAEALKETLLNYNVYFVAYAHNSELREKSRAAELNAAYLSEKIGSDNLIGYIYLQSPDANVQLDGHQVNFSSNKAGVNFRGFCVAPFKRAWPYASNTIHCKSILNSASLPSSVQPHNKLGVPSIICEPGFKQVDDKINDYISALVEMIHHVGDHEITKHSSAGSVF
ncbi:MAG: hypothetical protein Q4C05_02735 [Akkermansia sp.]|nr:hypothetical protein [Akkermansia sp.]